ncbi:AAA family ATPase [bacterium]|nr:AAA family ATPase [bacterium]
MTGSRNEGSSLRVPRIESIEVRNYRVLKHVKLSGLRPLSVFLGPNGSGKSTLFDVFAFLAESFTEGLRRAWEKRGRFKDLRSRSATGPIVIELKYREHAYGNEKTPVMTYHLEIDEDIDGPFALKETLRWRRMRGKAGRPFEFIRMERGEGYAVSGEVPDEEDARVPTKLISPETLAISTLGQFREHPRVSALRSFVTGWHLSYLTLASTRGTPDAGAQEHLSPTGHNLANVMQYLAERHPALLERILKTLANRVPRLETVTPEVLADGRLLLRIKDAPFEEPVLAKYASDGTLKMLAYLLVLYDPAPRPLVGIEEPENFLHPRLLPELNEECRKATNQSQLLVTTHSPFFINGLRPDELFILFRDEQGYTRAISASTIPEIEAYIENGAQLGDLWMEGHFPAGDPLVNQGGMRPRAKK